eukprot:6324928-Ditylum_brightwellii.AAC.1
MRTISLSYVTRVTALATRPASVRADDLPYGEEYELVKEELVAQASHMHSLYCKDNVAVYSALRRQSE